MSLFAMIKQNAKNSLQNNWGSAIAVTLIPGFCATILSFFTNLATNQIIFKFNFGAMNFSSSRNFSDLFALFVQNRKGLLAIALITFVFTLLTVILLVPLQLGKIHWFYQMVNGNPQPVSGIFRFFESFKNFWKSIWYKINISIRQGLWALLILSIPAALQIVFLFILPYAGMSNTSGEPKNFLVFILSNCIIGLIFLLIALLFSAYMNKYFLSSYLLVGESEDMTVNQAIKTSITYTKGHRFNLLWFDLSFLGWAILCVILFPLLLYVLPYMQASFAIYACYLIENNKRAGVTPETSKKPKPPKEKKQKKTKESGASPSTMEIEDSIQDMLSQETTNSMQAPSIPAEPPVPPAGQDEPVAPSISPEPPVPPTALYADLDTSDETQSY